MNDKLTGVRVALVALAVMCAANGVEAQTAAADGNSIVVASAVQAASADGAAAAPTTQPEAPVAAVSSQTSLNDASAADPDAGGTVAELQRLIQAGGVTELRTA